MGWDSGSIRMSRRKRDWSFVRIQFNLHGDVQRREICFQRTWDILLQTFQNNDER